MTAGSVYIFATLFFMINGHGIWAWLVAWVPIRVRRQFDECGELAWETMAGYTRGVVVSPSAMPSSSLSALSSCRSRWPLAWRQLSSWARSSR